MDDGGSFRSGVLDGRDSVKGLNLVGSDGRAGRISWASYAPGESYLVVTTGRLRRSHRLVPAGAVVQVTDDDVFVSLTRDEIEHLPLLPHPQASVYDEDFARMLAAFERAAATPRGAWL
jgi:hypothetical protein